MAAAPPVLMAVSGSPPTDPVLGAWLAERYRPFDPGLASDRFRLYALRGSRLDDPSYAKASTGMQVQTRLRSP